MGTDDENEISVYGGIDTHKDTHHVAVIDEHGRPLGDREFRAHRRRLSEDHRLSPPDSASSSRSRWRAPAATAPNWRAYCVVPG